MLLSELSTDSTQGQLNQDSESRQVTTQAGPHPNPSPKPIHYADLAETRIPSGENQGTSWRLEALLGKKSDDFCLMDSSQTGRGAKRLVRPPFTQTWEKELGDEGGSEPE